MGVESRNGAVSATKRATRFRSPLIKPDVPISSIRLSDRLHTEAHAVLGLARRWTPNRPNISWDEKRFVPLVEWPCRWRRNRRTRRSTWLFPI